MHGPDDPKIGQPGMGNFPIHERLRDHAGDSTTGFEARVGDDAHKAHIAAAVHEADSASGQQLAGFDGRLAVHVKRAEAGTTEYADRLH